MTIKEAIEIVQKYKYCVKNLKQKQELISAIRYAYENNADSYIQRIKTVK